LEEWSLAGHISLENVQFFYINMPEQIISENLLLHKKKTLQVQLHKWSFHHHSSVLSKDLSSIIENLFQLQHNYTAVSQLPKPVVLLSSFCPFSNSDIVLSNWFILLPPTVSDGKWKDWSGSVCIISKWISNITSKNMVAKTYFCFLQQLLIHVDGTVCKGLRKCISAVLWQQIQRQTSESSVELPRAKQDKAKQSIL